MEEILITGGVGIATSAISAVVTWILARRKYNSEVDSNLIENMEKSLEFYEKLSDDNKTRLDKALAENASLRKSVDELLEENKQLRKEMDVLKIQVMRLATSICTDLSCQLRNSEYSTLNMKGNEEIKS